MTRTAELRRRWRSGEKTYGLWLGIPSPVSAELAAITGCDYVCIDQQHGLIGYEHLVSMLFAIGTAGPIPLTRVAANDPSQIGKALDAGACGVVVPMVNSAEEAARAVSACRYPPQRNRSYGPIRAARVMGAPVPSELGEAALCVAMVETREGLEQLAEIAGTPGIDAIYVGPADLAVSLGLPPGLDKSEPEHVAVVERILAACKAAGIGAGIQCGSGKSARQFAARGFNIVTVAKDNTVLEAAFRQNLAAALGDDTDVHVAYS